ncbi:MAG TPA: sulfatase-like hydrolase/transferase [Bacteroidales bacterium]|nr:sulfatase-like hydrolase/transferase [Bacteroidales bacterium]HNR43140.1 sulfatase-like hydrolase/transferase [Bacteroidales bacterium]HPM19110.1 sulfatase-like hydrolase/transferase [Bacteroidales bacterium]HQH25738.1 sulfatase-like hydrolase/transferase [Bacteroidales bacterium]
MQNPLLPLSSLLLMGAVTGSAPLTNACVKTTDSGKRPNILFLFADDQRADALGCAGNTYIKTPNIDRLAGNGVRFTNAYVMGGHHGAISAPSRAMLMTGKNLFHVYDVLDGKVTMPAYFSGFGYETFATGKWHNGAASLIATFQKAENVFLGGMSDHFQVPCQDLDSSGKLTDPVIKGFSTDIFAETAVRYLKDYASSGKKNPFFCYVAFTAPHDPRSPQADYTGRYRGEAIPLPGNFMPLHPFEFDDMNVRDETLAPWPRTTEIIQASLADYYGLITHLDDRVGYIVRTLTELGLADNTIIIYAADNGLAVGSHGLLGKQNLYEHSMKVPLIISGPGIPKNELRNSLIYLYDLYPTLAKLCRLPVPGDIDGKDLVKVITGREKNVRGSLYTAYRNTVRAVRDEEWKLIRYPERNYTQLFNLREDPLEINNLASLPEFMEKTDEMMKLLEKWYAETDDTATLNPKFILPLEYDYKKLRQIRDQYQPGYVIERYFEAADMK